MTIVNTTNQNIVILDEYNEIIKEFPASELPITFAEKRMIGEPLPDGTPTSFLARIGFENVPEYKDIYNTVYIVDKSVRYAFSSRFDMMYPADPVVDEAGNIIGYRSLSR